MHTARDLASRLEPANVLLETQRHDTDTGPGATLATWVAKVTDFGLAKIIDLAGAETRTGAIIGTPAYMSPEQAKAEHGTIGPATDIYSLGAILYDLLVGRPPFQGRSDAETLRQVAYEQLPRPRRATPSCPLDLEAICLKCLEKTPTHRYASADALAADLRRFLAGEPTQARPLSKMQRAARWTSCNRGIAAMLATVALLLASITAISVVSAWRVNEARNAAESNLARADASAAKNERLAYIGRLRIAADAIKRADFGEARRQLTAARGTDGKLGGFEWAYLSHVATETRWLNAPGSGGRSQSMYQVRFTTDGRCLVGGQASGKIFIWDAHSGQLVRDFQAHSSCVNAFSFYARRASHGVRELR